MDLLIIMANDIVGDVAGDGKSLGKKAGGLLVGLGGIAAGIALGFQDLSFGMFDDISDQFGLDSAYLDMGIEILGAIMILIIAFSFKASVSGPILNMLFGFICIMLGTYLIIKAIRLLISFIKTGRPEGGG